MFSSVYSWGFLFLILITSILAIYCRVSVRSIYAMGAICVLMVIFFALSGAYWLALAQFIFGMLPLLYVFLKVYKMPGATESQEGA